MTKRRATAAPKPLLAPVTKTTPGCVLAILIFLSAGRHGRVHAAHNGMGLVLSSPPLLNPTAGRGPGRRPDRIGHADV